MTVEFVTVEVDRDERPTDDGSRIVGAPHNVDARLVLASRNRCVVGRSESQTGFGWWSVAVK